MTVTVGTDQPWTVVHRKSDGMSVAFPDVCKTPAPPARLRPPLRGPPLPS